MNVNTSSKPVGSERKSEGGVAFLNIDAVGQALPRLANTRMDISIKRALYGHISERPPSLESGLPEGFRDRLRASLATFQAQVTKNDRTLAPDAFPA